MTAHNSRILLLGLLAAGVARPLAAQRGAERLDPMGRLALAAEAEIRGTESDLYSVGWIGIGPDGRIVAAQPRLQQYRTFTASGAAPSTIGRRGSGPGEFQRPGPGMWLADTLWLYDESLRRFSVHRSDGSFVRNVLLPQADAASSAKLGIRAMIGMHPQALLPGGLVVGPATISTAGGDEPPLPIVILGLDGSLRRVVANIPWEQTSARIATGGGGSFGVVIPFAPRTQWALSPDGRRLAIARADVDRGVLRLFVVRTETGDTIARREWAYRPRPIPQRVIDSATARALSVANAGGRLDEIRKQLKVPGTYPPVAGILAADDGAVWMRINVGDDVRWRLVDAGGASVGEVVLPSGETPIRITADRVWSVDRDPDGFVTVRRRRLVR